MHHLIWLSEVTLSDALRIAIPATNLIRFTNLTARFFSVYKPGCDFTRDYAM